MVTKKKSSKAKSKKMVAKPKTSKTIQSAVAAKTAKTTKKITLEGLNKWNLVLAALHAIQGIVILALSRASTLPVNTHFLTNNTLAAESAGQPVLSVAVRHLFDVNLAYLVAAFFFMSAIAHLVIATIYRKHYENNLKTGINKARWIEYGLSAGTMMIAISLLSGIYDLSSLIMVFALIAVMNLMGLVMEIYNQGAGQTNWLSYGVGCVAGIVPWVAVAIYLKSATIYGTGSISTFVFWIYGSMFVLFASFAVNMYLQHKKTGKWADYLYSERAYMVLSLVAKSALAWQVFAGTLRP